MLASFMLLVDFNAVSWEGVKFRGRACQRCDSQYLCGLYKIIILKRRIILCPFHILLCFEDFISVGLLYHTETYHGNFRL